ncbi:MAG: aminotransferase [Streptococcaceae bacterium]|jgi:hypothetical protein|nr:aminotransferase [Streptococcaceae bacterium]
MTDFTTYPLENISLQDAVNRQFAFVDCMTHHFRGEETLSLGDLGVFPGINQPRTTRKVEKVLAEFFHVEEAMLVQGAGTGAIRLALHSALKVSQTLLVHDAPIYPSTESSILSLGIKTVRADFNKLKGTEKLPHEFDAVLIQYTRQKPDDSYDMEKTVQYFKQNYPSVKIISDDNYAVMKVKKIGAELGASLSCFSTFKLLGPEGVGCIVGDGKLIDLLRRENYSGGSQIQGHQAMAVLRGLTYAPVALANEAAVVEEVKMRLENIKEIPGVARAYIANAQSKVLLIEFKHPIAEKVLHYAGEFGAAPYPVGAESRYELVPMFYKVSGTFKAFDQNLLNTTIRINPNRAGAETIMNILKHALVKAGEVCS